MVKRVEAVHQYALHSTVLYDWKEILKVKEKIYLYKPGMNYYFTNAGNTVYKTLLTLKGWQPFHGLFIHSISFKRNINNMIKKYNNNM